MLKESSLVTKLIKKLFHTSPTKLTQEDITTYNLLIEVLTYYVCSEKPMDTKVKFSRLNLFSLIHPEVHNMYALSYDAIFRRNISREDTAKLSYGLRLFEKVFKT